MGAPVCNSIMVFSPLRQVMSPGKRKEDIHPSIPAVGSHPAESTVVIQNCARRARIRTDRGTLQPLEKKLVEQLEHVATWKTSYSARDQIASGERQLPDPTRTIPDKSDRVFATLS